VQVRSCEFSRPSVRFSQQSNLGKTFPLLYRIWESQKKAVKSGKVGKSRKTQQGLRQNRNTDLHSQICQNRNYVHACLFRFTAAGCIYVLHGLQLRSSPTPTPALVGTKPAVCVWGGTSSTYTHAAHIIKLNLTLCVPRRTLATRRRSDRSVVH
jgi:hypothetical protein